MATLAMVSTSCSDSFLESDPIMQETEATFYNTDDQMFKALMGAYDVLQLRGGQPLSAQIAFGEVRSDNARTGGGGNTDQPDLQKIEAFTNTEVNTISDAIWKRLYQGIYRANLVINAKFDSEATKIYKAEAKFLRAWYHFDLLRTYGPCVISLETVYPDGHTFERSTRAEVNAQITKDLEEAIPVLLPEHSDQMKGRITKYAAEALLAKVLIYQADWNNDDAATFKKAIPLLEDIINSGKYQLFTDYSKLFIEFSENNSESLFEVQRTSKSGWTNWGNSEASEGSITFTFMGPRGLTPNHPVYYDGYGFVLPSKSTVDYFLPEDTERLKAYILTKEALEEGTDTKGKPNKWNISQYGGTPETAGGLADFQGYASKKYAGRKAYEIIGNLALNRTVNERMIRYAEVYLLLAEAELRGNGNEAKAKEYLNTLRASRGQSDVNTMMSKYSSRFSSVLDCLWYERRVELMGEGDRWYDLVRSGRAKEVMAPHIMKEYGTAWEDKFIYLPIGSIEIDNSKGSLTPYPNE